MPTPSGGVSAPGALTSAGALALRQAAGSIAAVGGRAGRRVPQGSQAVGAVGQAGRETVAGDWGLEERAALRELRSAPTPRRSRDSRTNWPLSSLLRQ